MDPSHECASVGRPVRTYLQQLCADTGCSLEDLPGMMEEREKEREFGKSMLATQLDNDDVEILSAWANHIIALTLNIDTCTNWIKCDIF